MSHVKIETDRLLIRSFTEKDFDLFSSLLSDPLVMEFSQFGPLSKEQAREYFEKRIIEKYRTVGYSFYAVTEKKTGQFLGFVGPVDQVIDGELCLEVGYRLDPEYWGKGYASEAVQAVVDYAFQKRNTPYIIAIIEPKNTRSVRVAKKVGYTYWKSTIYSEKDVDIYRIDRIKLAPYDESWPSRYQEEVKSLSDVFGLLPITFFHIGSTSIKGSIAKPIIDILGVVSDITKVDTYNKKMEELGYTVLGEAGMRFRRFYTKKKSFPTNLHLFEETDPEVNRHLSFRKFLSENPKLLEKYSKRKKQLTIRYPGNMNKYCMGKEQIIKEIDYEAASKGFRKYSHSNSFQRKKDWTKDEIIDAMQANMQLNMTYFAKYLPSLEIVYEPDVTVVRSSIPDDSFNTVFGARFNKNNIRSRIDAASRHFLENNLPFSWWVGEMDFPPNLAEGLVKKGFKKKEVDVGMVLDLTSYDSKKEDPSFFLQRVSTKECLKDFCSVYRKIGGYPRVYEDLYHTIPTSLISEGASYEMYVGYVKGDPIITGLLILHANVAGIYFVMTVPKMRNKGYGTEMMHALLVRAKKKGYTRSTLQASEEGIRLYQKIGYSPLCRFVEYSF